MTAPGDTEKDSAARDERIKASTRFLRCASVCAQCDFSEYLFLPLAGVRGGGDKAAGNRHRTGEEDSPVLRRVHVHPALPARWHHANGKTRQNRQITDAGCVSGLRDSRWTVWFFFPAVCPQHVRRYGIHQHLQDWHAHTGQVWQHTECNIMWHQGVGVLQFRPWSCAVCYCRLHYSSFFCCCSVSTIQHAHLKTLKELDISSSKATSPLRIFFHSQIQWCLYMYNFFFSFHKLSGNGLYSGALNITILLLLNYGKSIAK